MVNDPSSQALSHHFSSSSVASTVHSILSTRGNDNSPPREGDPGGSFRHRRDGKRGGQGPPGLSHGEKGTWPFLCDSRRRTLSQVSQVRFPSLKSKVSSLDPEVRSRDLDKGLPLDRAEPTFLRNSPFLPSRVFPFPFLGEGYWCVFGEGSPSWNSK